MKVEKDVIKAVKASGGVEEKVDNLFQIIDSK